MIYSCQTLLWGSFLVALLHTYNKILQENWGGLMGETKIWCFTPYPSALNFWHSLDLKPENVVYFRLEFIKPHQAVKPEKNQVYYNLIFSKFELNCMTYNFAKWDLSKIESSWYRWIRCHFHVHTGKILLPKTGLDFTKSTFYPFSFSKISQTFYFR